MATWFVNLYGQVKVEDCDTAEEATKAAIAHVNCPWVWTGTPMQVGVDVDDAGWKLPTSNDPHVVQKKETR